MDELESAEPGALNALGVPTADPPDTGVRGELVETGELGSVGDVGARGCAAARQATQSSPWLRAHLRQCTRL